MTPPKRDPNSRVQILCWQCRKMIPYAEAKANNQGKLWCADCWNGKEK